MSGCTGVNGKNELGIGGTVAAGVEGGNCDGGCGPEGGVSGSSPGMCVSGCDGGDWPGNGGNGLSGGGCPGEGVNVGSGLSPGVKKSPGVNESPGMSPGMSGPVGVMHNPNQEVVQVVHQQCQV